jgi:Tol biopolymer transport system component
VFSSDAGGFAAQGTLWTVRRDGSGRRELLSLKDAPGGAADPAWSHNGRLIAFTTRFQGPTDRPGMYILSLADSKLHRVAEYGFQQSPRFSADDSELYWMAVTNPSASLLRIAINPETGDPVAPPQPLHNLSGISNSLSVTRDGAIAMDEATDDDNLWDVGLGARNAPAEPVRLTHESARVAHPAMSVTGDIAFTEWIPGQPMTTWLRHPDGKTEQVLPSTPIVCPEFSFDGARMFALGSKDSLWVDLATRRATPVPFALNVLSFARLSPDNAEVAYHKIGEDGRMAVWLRSMAGGAEHLLAEDAEGIGFPSWSPDGQTLAVELKRGDQTHLALVSRRDRRIVPLVTDRGNSWPSAWSPDGKAIAYAGERDGVWNVWTVDVASGVSRQVTHFTLPVGYVRYPVYTPKGDRLVFERAMRTATIWTMQVK